MRTSIKLLLFLLCYSLVDAQTLRPNHWIENDLRHYWNRQLLWDLSPLERPFTQEEIAAAWGRVSHALPEPGLQLLKRLPGGRDSQLGFGWLQLDNAYRDDGQSAIYHAVQRGVLGVQIFPKLQIVTAFYVDNHLDADSSYIGKRQSGVAAYMEQAYIIYDFKGFRAKFGRDYLVWGPGLDASLHISAASRPMDHFYLSWKNRWIKLSYFTGSLDRTEYPIKGQASVQHRYLSGHRLELRPLKYMRIGLNETALFGGPHAGNDFALWNPVLFYTGVQFNGPQTANVLASLDVALMPLRNVMLYGSYLLDDIQFEKEEKDDQEPAEHGFLAGLNWADPFQIAGLDLFTEYTRVTNRTYNGQGGAWEKYLHRNVPIGHFLGNDFDRLILGFRHRPRTSLRFGLTYEQRRRGQGRITDEFTTPWRDIPDGQSYNEPFPTGLAERSDNYRLTTRWQPLLWLYGELDVSYWQIDNFENQLDLQKNYWDVRINFAFEFLGTFSIR